MGRQKQQRRLASVDSGLRAFLISELYAHRSILAAKSSYFRTQLDQQSTADNVPATVTLDLSMIKQAIPTFQSLLVYFYTNQIQADPHNHQSVSVLVQLKT